MGENWNELCWKPKLDLVTELLPQSKPLSSTSDSNNENNDDSAVASPKPTIVCKNSSCTASTTDSDLTDKVEENVSEIAKTEEDSADECLCSENCRKSTPIDSLADHLPLNSYFYNGKYSYIFPGAEICSTDTDDDSSSASSDSDDDSEEKQRHHMDDDQDDCSSIDVSSSCTSKSPSHLPETEANITLSNDQLLLQNLETDGGNDSETTDGYGSPHKKRTSMDSVGLAESDGNVVAQKRCKLSND